MVAFYEDSLKTLCRFSEEMTLFCEGLTVFLEEMVIFSEGMMVFSEVIRSICEKEKPPANEGLSEAHSRKTEQERKINAGRQGRF